MSHPTVTAHRIEPNRNYAGWLLVTVTCPHCGREHVHGVKDGEPVGHRAAHCHGGGYVITEVPR